MGGCPTCPPTTCSVLQPTPSQRRKVWSPFSLRVVVEEHNYQSAQLDNKMPTSAEHVVMFMMQSMKNADLIGQQQVSAMPTTQWLQHDQTLPLYEGCV